MALGSLVLSGVGGGTFDPARAIGPLTPAEERALRRDNSYGGNSFRECDVCPEMVVVPAGKYTMGSPESQGGYSDEWPQREVTIARPFAVGKFDVTFDEWDACVAEDGCADRPRDERWGRGKRPVIHVSWDDITKEYLPWLSRKTGKTYRLLTEAEWEYAARAGTTTRFHFGDNESDMCTYANITDMTVKEKDPSRTTATCRDGFVYTAPVGSFQAAGFKLHDMHGNVWEWVQDCYGKYKDTPSDGSARETVACRRRVFRGGSCGAGPARPASLAPAASLSVAAAEHHAHAGMDAHHQP